MTELRPCWCPDRVARSSYAIGEVEHGRCACGGAFTVRLTAKPITVTRAELEHARAHPLALFDRMLLELHDRARAAARPE